MSASGPSGPLVSKCRHGLSTSILVLLHSALMLSVVKMLLKGEVGDVH